MEPMCYIGLDVHKRKNQFLGDYWVKDTGGNMQGRFPQYPRRFTRVIIAANHGPRSRHQTRPLRNSIRTRRGRGGRGVSSEGLPPVY
jgi:hypothetical protein